MIAKDSKKSTKNTKKQKEPDIGEFDHKFVAHLVKALAAQPKQAVSIRLDPFVVKFFKSFGDGYQTRISAVLRAYALRYEQAAGKPLLKKIKHA